MSPEARCPRQLLERCQAGDKPSLRAFQERYGSLIYNLPRRRFGLSEEDASAFYLYAFDGLRVIRRALTYEGRGGATFEGFLSFVVVRTLCLEWLRTRKLEPTLSLDAPVGPQGSCRGSRLLGDLLAAPEPQPTGDGCEAARATERLTEGLSPDSRLLFKLLNLAETELEPSDLRHLSKMSGRSLGQTAKLVEAVRRNLVGKDEKRAALWQRLTTISTCIMAYQHRLQEIRGNYHLDHSGQARMKAEADELERKLEKRYQQQARCRTALARMKTATPYKDIAELTGKSMGSVSAAIARLRAELRTVELRRKAMGSEQ